MARKWELLGLTGKWDLLGLTGKWDLLGSTGNWVSLNSRSRKLGPSRNSLVNHHALSLQVQEFLDLDLIDVYLSSSSAEISFRSRVVELLVKDIISANRAHRRRESCAIDVGKRLLEFLDYDRNGSSIRTRVTIPLQMLDGQKEVSSDLCVEDEVTMVKIMVATEDKTSDEDITSDHLQDNPEAQLMAESIAAIQDNERLHELYDLHVPLEGIVFPGIVFVGTLPWFYLISMRKTLADCVKEGMGIHARLMVLHGFANKVVN
ncbi:hypothetical protein SELMODRAFT_418720 [Selaginella moellendorffii]|uniref:Uncharacterized protein n=1 Tax=Selaginella moellendorffii TaxID=88036 RepID=D8S6Y1_SELML|nr:hypothetical protein SELMODRAFT_418720 [Selaginella moellendorffii]